MSLCEGKDMNILTNGMAIGVKTLKWNINVNMIVALEWILEVLHHQGTINVSTNRSQSIKEV